MAPLLILSLLFSCFQATYLLLVMKFKLGVIVSDKEPWNDELFPEIDILNGVSLILFRGILSFIYFLKASACIDYPTVLVGVSYFSLRNEPIRTELIPKLSLLLGHFAKVSKPFDLFCLGKERDYCLFPWFILLLCLGLEYCSYLYTWYDVLKWLFSGL